jgi:signal transduction histidine kinase
LPIQMNGHRYALFVQLRESRTLANMDKIVKTADGQWAVVQMTDTGIGMSPEVQRHIFERFYTGDPARNRRKSGNGLGLSIVKKIVDLHHGQIQVESEVGKGTTFTVRLPCRPT